MARLRITCKKSPIGYDNNQKKVMQALGLRKVNGCVEHDDSPQIMGMIHKVRHLVEVEEITQEGTA